MGPTPTPPPAAGAEGTLDPARMRLLRVLAGRRAGPGPSVNDLAGVVGGHPNTTRHHLRALVAAGLVDEEREPRAGGRGRPAIRYAVTRAGRDVASPGHAGAAAEEYVALAAAFAERLAETGGRPGDDARAIGKAWGAGLVASDAIGSPLGAGDGPTPTARVVALLDRLGFSPAPEQVTAVTTPTGGDVIDHAAGSPGTTVLLRTCPLLDAARRHPEVVCEVHLGLVAGALEAIDEPSEGLRLSPFARPGACVLDLPTTLVG